MEFLEGRIGKEEKLVSQKKGFEVLEMGQKGKSVILSKMEEE